MDIYTVSILLFTMADANLLKDTRDKKNGCADILPEKDVLSHQKSCSNDIDPSEHSGQNEEHKHKVHLDKFPCSHVAFGCCYEGTIQELLIHHRTSVSQHLEMVGISTKQLIYQNSALKNDQKVIQEKIEQVSVEYKKYRETSEKMLDDREYLIIKLEDTLKEVSAKFDHALRDIASLQKKESLRSLKEEREAGVWATNSTVFKVEQDIMDQIRQFQITHKNPELKRYDGTLIWKITDYAKKKHDAVTGNCRNFYSPAFWSSPCGYKMCCRVYPNGDGSGENSHMSLFFTIMKGDYDALLSWPFQYKVTFMILDQEGTNHIKDAFRPDPTSSSFKRPITGMNISNGCPTFVKQADVESPPYLKDDTMFIKLVVQDPLHLK